MLVLMFLRTRKRKSKIDFALLDKSNKMVSGVKLILTKQNPRRLNTARRLRIKTTTTTKQLQRRLYTPKNSSPPLLSYTVTQRRRTRDSHTWKRNAGAMGAALPAARAPRTQLFTLCTRSCAGASPAAGAPALCPRSSCRRRGPSGAPPRASHGWPSGRPSGRPPAAPSFLPSVLGRSSCRPRVAPSPCGVAAAQLLSRPGAPWRCRARAACSSQGKALPWSRRARVPPGRCCAASSLSACPGEPPRGRRRLPCCLSPLHLSWHSAPGCRSARGPAPAPCRRRTRTTRTRS